LEVSASLAQFRHQTAAENPVCRLKSAGAVGGDDHATMPESREWADADKVGLRFKVFRQCEKGSLRGESRFRY
jgi:hypothetical protein